MLARSSFVFVFNELQEREAWRCVNANQVHCCTNQIAHACSTTATDDQRFFHFALGSFVPISSVVQPANFPPRLHSTSMIVVSVAQPPPDRGDWKEFATPSSSRIGGGAVLVAGGTFIGGIFFTGGALRSNAVPDGGALRGDASQPEAVVFGGGAPPGNPPASPFALLRFPKMAHIFFQRKKERFCFICQHLPTPRTARLAQWARTCP